MNFNSALLIFLILLMGMCVDADGADVKNYIKKGDHYALLSKFDKAAAWYKKAAHADSNNLVAKEKLAGVLVQMGDFTGAETLYKMLANNPKADAIDKFRYAQVLCREGEYEIADLQYRAFAEAVPNDPRAKEFINFTEKIRPLLKDEKIYQLINLPENTQASEIGPTFCLYDLCFSSNRGKASYDLYILHGAHGSKVSSAEKLTGKINGRLDEGPATFSRDGKEMIFTRGNYNKKASDGTRKHGLYHAVYDSSSHIWVKIEPLSFVDYNYNFVHPSLSRDGNKLFFASDKPGGYGETDIYMSSKQGGAWSAPVNLGPGINTPGNDMFPYIANDSTLYFASDSRVGLGGLDIYSAILVNNEWGHVTNGGTPINSSSDDFGLILDETGNTGYLVSNRPGGAGSDDIYRFIKKK